MPARRASRAVLTVVALRLVAAGMGVVGAGVLSRRLGPSAFGELSLAFTVAILASNLGELGSTQVVVGEMAARPHRRAELAAGYAVLRASVGTVLAACGAVVLVVLLDHPPARLAGIAIVATVPLAGMSSLVVLAQARLRPQVGAALALGQSGLWLASVLVVAALRGSLPWYGLAFLGCACTQAAATWVVVVRDERPAWPQFRPALGWMAGRGWPLAVAGVLGTIYYRLDGVLVFRWAGAAEAGVYAAGYRFLDVAQLAPGAVAAVLLPVVARGWSAGDRAAVARVVRLALSVTAAVGIPVGVGSVVLGPRVAVAVFGPRFARSGDVLAVLGLAFFSIACGYVYSGVLVATGGVRVVGVVSAVAAVASVAGDLLVVPRWGAVGAAWVTVAVEYLVSTSLAVWISRRYGLGFPWYRVLAAVAASMVMGVVGWALRDSALVVVVPMATATYTTLAFALGAVTRDDLRALAHRRLALGANQGPSGPLSGAAA